MCLFLVQDQLALSVSKSTYTKWVYKHWGTWAQWLLGIGVPAPHLVRSSRSVDSGERDEFSLPGYACSTAALLALFCRWEAMLAGDRARASARDLRKAWVQHFFTGRDWVWPVPVDLQANWKGLRQVGALTPPKQFRRRGQFACHRLATRPNEPSQPSSIELRLGSPVGTEANDLMLPVANGVVDLSNALQQHRCLKHLYNLPRRFLFMVETLCFIWLLLSEAQLGKGPNLCA